MEGVLHLCRHLCTLLHHLAISLLSLLAMNEFGFRLGCLAYNNFRELEHCPFEPGTEIAEAWCEGWLTSNEIYREASEESMAQRGASMEWQVIPVLEWKYGGVATVAGQYWAKYPNSKPIITPIYEGYQFADTTVWCGPLVHPPLEAQLPEPKPVIKYEKHDIKFDGCHPHNGEYWYSCQNCGASDWIPSYGEEEDLSIHKKPSESRKSK
jgi:hypothetical protein